MSRPPEYDGTVERTDDGGVVRFERHLPYPVRDVWDAVTNPERLAQWWLPFDADITVDLREGGEIVFVRRDGEPFTMTCTIHRVEPPMLLEHSHVEPGSFMRWELQPTDSGCILRLAHFLPDPEAGIERCVVVGLHTSLARLGPCLAGSPTSWDWDTLAVTQEQYAQLGLAPHPVPPPDT